MSEEEAKYLAAAREPPGTGVFHYPFVEFEPKAGKGLLSAMAAVLK